MPAIRIRPTRRGATSKASPFTGFLNGSNILSIVVPNNTESSPDNADGPTGVQAQFTVVPEASTWAMLCLGFVGLALAGRRTRRTSALA